jgi:D-3-phosphoglycerate dehydrogenase / 2-oxoglutarate reductase
MLIKRTDTSSYFPTDFNEKERFSIESIKSCTYLDSKAPVPESGDIILITNTHTKLSHWSPLRERVKAIVHPNSGYDNLLNDLWEEVPVILGNPIRAQAVAEWSLACLYQHSSYIRHHTSWPQSRTWDRGLIDEKNILIIGDGHISQILQQKIHASIYDPWKNKVIDLKKKWDIVIVAASLNEENIHLLNTKFFQHCSPECLIINPARGEFIDEMALIEFLKNNPNARAYLDVHHSEPYGCDPYQTTQVIATPHIAGVWSGLVDTMITFETKMIQDILNNSILPELILQNRKTAQGFYR